GRGQQQDRAPALAAGRDDVLGDLVDQHHVGGQPAPDEGVDRRHVRGREGLDRGQVEGRALVGLGGRGAGRAGGGKVHHGFRRVDPGLCPWSRGTPTTARGGG